MNNLFKFLKIFGIVLVCLIVVTVIGGLIFLKTFDIKKYKPQIVTAANKALGRTVDFNDVELKVSLKEGIRFHLTGLTVSDDPQFGQGPFAKVEELSVGLDVLSFINARRISVPNIYVKSPEITVIRNAAGVLNVQTIGAASKAGSSANQGAPSTAALPAVFINSLRIEGARLNFIEQSISPNFEGSVSQLDVIVDHFSLTGPFNFALEAAVLSPQRNLKIDGSADLNLLAKEVRLSNVRIATDLGQFPLAELRRLPMLKGVPLPEVLEGKYSALIRECVLSEQGMRDLTLDSQLESGKVMIKEVVPGISIDMSQIGLSVNAFSLGKPFDFALTAAYMSPTPNIDLKGTVAYDVTTQAVQLSGLVFSTDLSLWPLATIKAQTAPLKDVPLPENLAGQLQVMVQNLSAGPKGLGDLKLDATLKEGTVSLKEVAPGISFEATKIDLALKDFSLNGPFTIALTMAYLNDMPDVDLKGIVSYDMKTQAVSLKDLKVALDLDRLSLQDLKSSMAPLKDVPMPQILGGKLEATIKDLQAGSQGLKSVLIDARLIDGRVEMKEAAPGVSFKASRIDMDVQNFSLTAPFNYKVQLAYLSDVPNISSSGQLSYNMQTNDIRLIDGALGLNLAKFDLLQLKSSVASLATVPFPETLSGDMRIAVKELTASPKGLGKMDLDVHWDKGAVSLKDIAPGISIAASDIGLELKNVSLDGPIAFRLNAAYLSDQPNIDLTGTARIDMPQSLIQLNSTVFKTDLGLLSMDKLRSSMSSLKEAALPQTLKGLLSVNVDELTAGPKGLVSLKTNGELTSASVKLKELTLPVDIAQVKFQADGTNAKLDDINVSLGKGKVSAKAAIDQYLTKPLVNSEVTIEGLDMAEILEQKEAPVKAEGLIYAKLKVQGDPSNLNSLVGDGVFDVKDAKLRDLNVLKAVFDNIKLPLVPNLSAMVMGALPEEYQKQFKKPDTDFKTVQFTAVFTDGMIHLEPIDVQSEVFSFMGKGTVGFDQVYSINSDFKLSKDLSDSLVKDVREPFAYLVDETGLISFPVIVKGKGAQQPIFEVLAMMKDMAQNALRNTVKQEAGKLLNKYLKVETPATETASPVEKTQTGDTAAPEGTSPQETSPQEQLIDGILGTIFK